MLQNVAVVDEFTPNYYWSGKLFGISIGVCAAPREDKVAKVIPG